MQIAQRHYRFLLPSIMLLALTLPGYASATLNYQTSVPNTYDLAVDTRLESECQKTTLAKTICLPSKQLIASHNRLANFSGLFWLLGTAGITGSEHIVVIGDNAEKRDFMAGWLYVAGQAEVSVVNTPISDLLSQEIPREPGRSKSTTRKVVYAAVPRTDLLLLKSEVHQELQSQHRPVVLDGRSESEYWGRSIKAARGGHLPGALHLDNPSMAKTQFQGPVLAYANDTVTGLAYLARLTASAIEAKLYLGGWVEWAADGSLPIDAASYPMEKRKSVVSDQTHLARTQTLPLNSVPVTRMATMLALGLLVIALAYLLGRRHGA